MRAVAPPLPAVLTESSRPQHNLQSWAPLLEAEQAQASQGWSRCQRPPGGWQHLPEVRLFELIGAGKREPPAWEQHTPEVRSMVLLVAVRMVRSLDCVESQPLCGQLTRNGCAKQLAEHPVVASTAKGPASSEPFSWNN